MEQKICKNCEEILVEKGDYYICPSCGSRFEKKAQEMPWTSQLNDAYTLIRSGEFLRAEEICGDLLSQNQNNYEAHWCLSLAKNGILFVDDVGNKKVPTCNQISERSFLNDSHTKRAIELAPRKIAEGYLLQADRIEKIRMEWLEKASKEPPYDIFISYKDSVKTEQGAVRTHDSEYCQDLYHVLTEKGYKVFFSRITLAGKVSEQYEPYIYGALKTAKMMIVYGEKEEFFNATWVKNEWGRYVNQIRSGEKSRESLIVAYQGMDVHDIPKPLLGDRQALEMGTPSSIVSLLEKVSKFFEEQAGGAKLARIKIEGGRVSKKASKVAQNTVQIKSFANMTVKSSQTEENILRNAWDDLSAGEWDAAWNEANMVLRQNPQNAVAVLQKILAKEEAKTTETLFGRKFFASFELLETLLERIDKNMANEILKGFYGMWRIGDAGYARILKLILPYDFKGREAAIDRAFGIAMEQLLYDSFDALLQTIESEKVDSYIEKNLNMAISAFLKKEYIKAQKYAKNVLTVEEGNGRALLLLCSADILQGKTFPLIKESFEKGLSFSPDVNEALNTTLKLLADSLESKNLNYYAREIVKYCPGELNACKDGILSVSEALLKAERYEDAGYFATLIGAENALDEQARKIMCLARVGATSVENIVESDVPVDTLPEYNEWRALISSRSSRMQLIEIAKKQREEIQVRERQREAERQRKREERERLLIAEAEEARKRAKKRAKIILWIILAIAVIAVLAFVIMLIVSNWDSIVETFIGIGVVLVIAGVIFGRKK